jgi:LysM repeat protein
MTPEPTSTSKICPTCGTRVSEDAARCSVCGRNLVPTTKPAQTKSKPVQGPRLPEITLNLPIAIGLFIILLAVGSGISIAFMSATGQVLEPTQTATLTLTPTITITPTEIPTQTPMPSLTPEPPQEYTVAAGDSCLLIAAIYNVNVQSIASLNNLAADCGILREGQTLLIPHPTPTASPQATNTLSASEATNAACDQVYYTVTASDTLGGISAAYNISMDSIRFWNGMTTDIVWEGMTLIIPLCERLPTAGPTPTPTTPPPYPAAQLLLPADGAAFSATNNTVTLQWAAVGTLRQNEAYSVVIEDLTEGADRRLVAYVTDTRYIIPASFRPLDMQPHVIRWYIQPVRQTGTNAEGRPAYEIAGEPSQPFVFSWSGLGIPSPTP